MALTTLFPSSYSTNESAFTSEKNLTGIVKCITLGTYKIDDNQMVIDGYYFGGTGVAAISGNLKYVQFKTDSSGNLINWEADGATDIDLDNVLHYSASVSGIVGQNGIIQNSTDGSVTIHTIDLENNLSVISPQLIIASIPEATDDTKGLVKFDDLTIKENLDGQLYIVEATDSASGIVKYDGTSIVKNGAGQLSVNFSQAPNASNSQKGFVQTDGNTTAIEDGKLVAKASGLFTAGTNITYGSDKKINAPNHIATVEMSSLQNGLHKIFIQSTQPATSSKGDIWIKI